MTHNDAVEAMARAMSMRSSPELWALETKEYHDAYRDMAKDALDALLNLIGARNPQLRSAVILCLVLQTQQLHPPAA